MTSENSADFLPESQSETNTGIGSGGAPYGDKRPERIRNTGSHSASPDQSKRADIGLAAPEDLSINTTGSRPALRQHAVERTNSPDAAAERQDPLVGQTLFEDYLITGVIGGGLATTTYEAKWISQDRVVAIKTTKHLQTAITSEFKRAAEAHLTLGQKNIVASLGLMETSLQRPFYVMEFIDAISLQDVIDASGSLDDEEEIAEVVLQLCDALEFAHAKGIVHGNLGCSNVMLAEVGEQIELKILDFGFSKVRDKVEEISGSRPLEQEPEPFDDLKKRDILALGVMLYEMVTGGSAQKLAADGTLVQRTKLALANPNILAPTELDDVLDEAMEPDLDWRFDEISDFREAFEEWLGKARQEHTGVTGVVQQLDASQFGSFPSHQNLDEQSQSGVDHFATPPGNPLVQARDGGLHEHFPHGDPADGSHPNDGAKVAEGNEQLTAVPPRRRSKRNSKLAKRTIFNLQQLKNTQAREEESLEMHITQVFKLQGPRVSPAKTMTRITMKIVASIAVFLLSMTFMILNWDKLGQAWIDTSTRLSAALRGEEPQGNFDDIDTRPPEETAAKAKKKTNAMVANGTAGGTGSVGGSASGGSSSGTGNSTASSAATNTGASVPASLPKPQQRFQYAEHPSYKDWVLKDVGAKRRLDGPRRYN